MPDYIEKQLWEIIPTLLYFAIGLVLFGLAVLLMDKMTPFSIRKELEEDQNIALGIVMGAALIGIAIILGSVIQS
jgi:putative membrane protein